MTRDQAIKAWEAAVPPGKPAATGQLIDALVVLGLLKLDEPLSETVKLYRALVGHVLRRSAGTSAAAQIELTHNDAATINQLLLAAGLTVVEKDPS